MKLHLIRHIAPDFPKGICYGQLNVPLPTNYVALHQQLITTLPTNYDAVYSSPLIRCALLATQISTSVIMDDRLKEVSFGNWEGCNWDDINATELNHWMQNYITVAPPNGESLTQVLLRFSSFIADIKTKPYKKTIVVTHAGIIRSALHVLNNVPIEKVMSHKVAFNEVFTFEI